jgi:putative effector of murein hydrolase
MTNFAETWVYLSRDPLLWLTATPAAYAIGDACYRASGRAPLANPVLIAVTLLAAVLWFTSTTYQSYFEGAQFVHFLLGPATVCLAYPLYANLPRVRKALLPLTAALLAGSVTAMMSALAIGYAFGVRGEALASLSARSTTTPVAIGIAERIGGSPTLTAVLVIITGIMGAAMATPLLNVLGLKDWRARGFAVGVAAHGIGSVRAMQVNPTAGAFAGLGMGLTVRLWLGLSS